MLFQRHCYWQPKAALREIRMDFFSDIFKKANDVKGEVKDAKEDIARTNADEEAGGKYFQSSGDESNANDPNQMKQQMQNLPEVAIASIDCKAVLRCTYRTAEAFVLLMVPLCVSIMRYEYC